MSREESLTDIAALAREDSPRGFAAFYALVHNQLVPDHAVKWVDAAYEARKDMRGVVIEAFRGSTKSTTFNTFVAFRLGQEPSGSALIIRASEAAAAEAGEKVADIVEHNPAWKAVFPNIVPDKDKGWSLRGYEVKDISKVYGEWRRENASRMDPSFVAMAYQSNAIIGMHPSLILLVDDIHTEENTSSDRELQRVRKLLTGTIFPTRRPNDPWTIFIGTPWVDKDVLQAVKQTGEYVSVRTPVYDEAGDPTWPSGMAKEQIERERKQDITGGAEFARMFMLDLEAAQHRVFKYHLYPSHLCNPMWVSVGGLDFASIMDPTRRTAQHSHFALAYVLKRPEGGAVVFDGILEQCSQVEAEGHVEKAQAMFPFWQGVVVEQIGVGDQFFQMLYRKPNMKLIPMPRGKRMGAKSDRLSKGLAPWLENGRVRISDAETKYLSALRQFFNRYPNVTAHDPGWDAADALYWALLGMPDALVLEPVGPDYLMAGGAGKPANPFKSLGNSQ